MARSCVSSVSGWVRQTARTVARISRISANDMPSLPLETAVNSLRDRKSTRLNSQSRLHLVCRLLLEKKKTAQGAHGAGGEDRRPQHSRHHAQPARALAAVQRQTRPVARASAPLQPMAIIAVTVRGA